MVSNTSETDSDTGKFVIPNEQRDAITTTAKRWYLLFSEEVCAGHAVLPSLGPASSFEFLSNESGAADENGMSDVPGCVQGLRLCDSEDHAFTYVP